MPLPSRVQQALSVPLQHALGATLIDVEDPSAGVRFEVGTLAVNGVGGLHAAALGALVELAAFLAVLPSLSDSEHAVTHAVSTQFIAAARQGDQVMACGELDRRTRRTAFLSVVVKSNGRLIARSQLTKTIVELT